MRVYIDCSGTYWRPHNPSGIPRVVRELCRRCEACSPAGIECRPVQWSLGAWRIAATDGPGPLYGRARRAAKWFQRRRSASRAELRSGRWLSAAPIVITTIGYLLCRSLVGLLGVCAALRSTRVSPTRGDTLLLPEFPYGNLAAIEHARRKGVRIAALIHDLIPLTHPHLFVPDRRVTAWFEWVGAKADAIVCVSATTARAVEALLRPRCRQVGQVHLGADFSAVVAPRAPGLPAPYFLMVGTVEPRKRHQDALDAFERLWAEGREVSLVLLGQPGWLVDGLLARIRSHPELGRRLHWLQVASDAELEAAYRGARALIAASETEGFGLPVVEALRRGTPVIASDIPVFREIAGPWADYFPMGDVAGLARLIRTGADGARRDVSGFRWQSWDEAVRGLLEHAVR